MDASCGIRRFARRLVVVFLVASVAAMFASTPALAQSLGSLGLGSSAGSGGDPLGTAVNNLTQVTAPVTQTVTPTAQAATTPVAQAAAPIAQTAATATAPIAQTAAPITAPVAETVTPVMQSVSAPVVQVTTPIVQAATPILEVAAPVVEPLTAGVLENASPLLDGNEQALAAVEPLTGSSRSASRLLGGPDTSSPTPVAPAVDTPAEVRTNALGTALTADLEGAGSYDAASVARGTDSRRGSRSARPALPFTATRASPEFASSAATSVAGAPKGTTASARPAPDPSLPSRPAGPSSVAAAFSGSGASIFVAALAAALLLVVPGSGRRLRLELAPWPLPVPLPSLERPG